MSETCPRRETLRAFVLGQLAVAEIDRVAAHLETCATCCGLIELVGEDSDQLLQALADGVGRVKPSESVEAESACRDAVERLARESFAEISGSFTPSGAARDDTAAPRPVTKQQHVEQQLGDFRLLREVGRGGMGIVYEAEQISLGRRVAVKVLPKLLDEYQKKRFEREAKSAGRLHHTNIVPVFGVGEHDGTHFYVMQFIEGLGLNDVVQELKSQRAATESRSFTPSARDFRVSLRPASQPTAPAAASDEKKTQPWNEPTRVYDSSKRSPAIAGSDTQPTDVNNGSLPFKESGVMERDAAVTLPGMLQSYWHSVALIGRQVADALDHAHGHGVLHRDIKPSNLLLDTHGTVWVADFGLAKAEDQENLTQTSDLLGTLRYMSPEAFEGKSDARSDVYALGLTLYELAALRPAFDERDMNKLMKQVTHSEPPRLRRINSAVPLDLETIIHKAMEREPATRYPTARELAEDLQRFLEDEPIRARRIGVIERLARWSRRNRELSAALAIILLLLVAVTVGSAIAASYFQRLASSESTLRKDAENAEANEKKLRTEAQTAQKNEAAERQRAEEAQVSLRRNLYFSEMIQAGLATESISGMGRVRELLSHWVPTVGQVANLPHDLRGWEWHLLSAMTEEALRIEPQGGGHSVAWSPDDRLLAVSTGGGVVLWDVAMWKPLAMLDGLGGMILGMNFSPDGKRLAAASLDRKLVVWDVASRQIKMTMTGPAGKVSWFPDGKRIAGFDFGNAMIAGSVFILDSETGEVQQQISEDLQTNYNVLDISPDGKWLATGGNSSTVNLWDTQSWKLAAKLTGHQNFLMEVRFHPTENWLASSSNDSTIRIWDLATQRELRKLTEHRQPVTGLAWSADGSRLASASWDFTARVWDGTTGVALREFRGHTNRLSNVSLNADGSRMASTSADGSLRLWDVASTPVVQTLDTQRRGASISAAWHPDGQRAVVDLNGRWDAWNVTTGERLKSGAGFSAQWSPDGKRFVVNLGKQIQVWDGDLTKPTHMTEFPDYSNAMDWHPDSRRLFFCDYHKLWSWDIETGEKRQHPIEVRDKVSLLVHPAGRWVLVGLTYGRIALWDLQNDRLDRVITTDLRETVNAMNWSPDGRQLLVGSEDHMIVVLDVATWTKLASYVGHTYPVRAVSWSADGTRIASASRDGTAQLWDVESGRSTLTLRHADEVHAAAFSRDGHKLLTASIDGKLKIWNASPAEQRRGLQPAALPPTPRPVKLPLAEQNQLVRKKLAALAIQKTADFAADQAVLLDGVKNLPVGGDVGRLTVFGPTAFPVIAPNEVQTRQKGRVAGPYCVLAAGRLDKGRVAAFGHDCWLIGAESFSKADSPQLLDNLLRWLADRADKSKPAPRIGLRWPEEIAKVLDSRGFPVERLTGDDWLSRLEHIDVLIALTHSTVPLMTESEADRVREFVQDGGGLLTASSGWVWRQYIAGPGQTLGADSLVNRLLGPAGILIDDGSASLSPGLSIVLPPAEAHWLNANRQALESAETSDAMLDIPDSLRTYLLRATPKDQRDGK